MPNVMAALPNIADALCSTPQSLANAHYYSPKLEKTVFDNFPMFADSLR